MVITKRTVVLLAMLLFATCEAQTFLKTFVIDSSSTIATSLNVRDSFFFVAGTIADTSRIGLVASYLAKFDYSGNKVSSVTLRDSKYLFFQVVQNQNSLINTDDGGMATVGDVVDTGDGKEFDLFSKFDSSGNLLFYRTYDFGLSNYRHLNAYGLVEFDSAYFIIGEVQLANYYDEFILAKVDLQGNLLFAKTYPGLPELYGGNDGICILPDSHLLICTGRSDENINYWETVLKTCFLEVDTAGNIIHQYCTPDNNTNTFARVAATKDGNYLSSGSYYALRIQGMDREYIDYLVKWDTGFNKLWSVKAGDIGYNNYFADFDQDAQGNIILCGQDLNENANSYAGCLAKVDTGSHLIWYRKYMVPTGLNPDYSQNYLTDMSLLPNGDIVAIGTWENTVQTSPFYFLQVGWILKVDSNGCMDDGSCGVDGINEIQPSSGPPLQLVSIYPNPSTGVFSVHAFVQLPAFTDIEVYDVMGRKVITMPLWHQTNLLNLNGFADGVYFYEITNSGRRLEAGKLVKAVGSGQ